ncbi:hypothetical protein N334_05491, partial [Pelecanus crispus]
YTFTQPGWGGGCAGISLLPAHRIGRWRGGKKKPKKETTKPPKETNPNPRRMLPRAQATALQSGTKPQTDSCSLTGPALWGQPLAPFFSSFLALVTCSPFG